MKYFWGALAFAAVLLVIVGAVQLLGGALRTIATIGVVLGVLVLIVLIVWIVKLTRR